MSNSSETFEQGDVLYTLGGEMVEYIAQCDNGHVVRPGFIDYEGNEAFSGLMEVGQLYRDPPTRRLNETIIDLNGQIAAKRQELTDLRESIKAEDTSSAEVISRVKLAKGLARVDDFIAGRITHVVVRTHTLEIKTFKEAFDDPDRYGRSNGLKLLTLFGGSKGDLSWRISFYSDGSGGSHEVFPATSLEEATEIARALFDADVAVFRDKEGYLHGFNYRVETAARLGFEIPSDLLERWNTSEISTAQHQVDAAEAELGRRREALAMARAKGGAV